MFKAPFIPVLIAMVGFSKTEIQLDIYRGDAKVGGGSYSEKFDHGRKTSIFILQGKEDDGTTRKIVQTKVIDRNAVPITESETITESGSGGKHEISLKVHYDDTGTAVLVVTQDDHQSRARTTERTTSPPLGYSLADESDLWFSQKQPSPGTTVRSTVFDIENARWQRVETTYVGKRWINLGVHRIQVHEVRDVRDGVLREVYLDDKGLPVLMKAGMFRTEKHF